MVAEYKGYRFDPDVAQAFARAENDFAGRDGTGNDSKANDG